MQRLHERGINLHPFTLESDAESCKQDSALLLFTLKSEVNTSGRIAYTERNESNGNRVILIVRGNKPFTIMYRRENQPLTCEALRVKAVIDNKTKKVLDIIQ